MARIKGWRKFKESKLEISWMHESSDGYIEVVSVKKNMNGNYQITHTKPTSYSILDIFKTKKKALDYTITFMKKYPNGY